MAGIIILHCEITYPLTFLAIIESVQKRLCQVLGSLRYTCRYMGPVAQIVSSQSTCLKTPCPVSLSILNERKSIKRYRIYSPFISLHLISDSLRQFCCPRTKLYLYCLSARPTGDGLQRGGGLHHPSLSPTCLLPPASCCYLQGPVTAGEFFLGFFPLG